MAGSVTGGCVEPAVYEEAEAVLAGGPPRLVKYGIADEEAFGVGLPCGGTVHIFVEPLDPALVTQIAAAVREERPVAVAVTVGGDAASAGSVLVRRRRAAPRRARCGRARQARRCSPAARRASCAWASDEVFVVVVRAAAATCTCSARSTTPPRSPRVGRFLGYHVTVCDARAAFVTPERFPDVDELVVEWPHEFLARRPWTSARRSACSPTTTSSTCRC